VISDQDITTDDGWFYWLQCPDESQRSIAYSKPPGGDPSELFSLGSELAELLQKVVQERKSVWYAERELNGLEADRAWLKRAFGGWNQPPEVSVADPDHVLPVGERATLRGSASDLEEDFMVWRWLQTDGPAVELNLPRSLNPSFTPTEPGVYGFKLDVWDALVENRTTATIRVTAVRSVSDLPPEAAIASPVAGSVFREGDPVTLAGSAVDAVDGSLQNSRLAWVSGIDGVLGTGSPLTVSHLSRGDHTITLSATNSRGLFGTALVTITIQRVADTENSLPEVTIMSPPDGGVFEEGTPIQFSGSAVDREDGRLTGDSLVWGAMSLAQGRERGLGFGEDLTRQDLPPGTHYVILYARDSTGASSHRIITILVTMHQTSANRAPVANAGVEQVARVGSVVTLDGSGSYDPDQDSLSYEWTQVSGPPVKLSDPRSMMPFFAPSEGGVYEFQITVSDGVQNGVPDHVAVHVTQDASHEPEQGGEWFVVWTEGHGGSFDIRGCRVASDGHPLDPNGILVQSGARGQPSVVYGDGVWLVAWWEEDEGGSVFRVTRVSKEGAPLDSEGVAVDTGETDGGFSLTFDGQNWVIVWKAANDGGVYLCRIDREGRILDPSGILVLPGDWGASRPSISFGSTHALLVYECGAAGDRDLLAVRVDRSGRRLDDAPRVITDAYNDQELAALTPTGYGWFAAWADQRDDAGQFIYGTRINQDGEALDPRGLLIATGPQEVPGDISSDGERCLVTWTTYGVAYSEWGTSHFAYASGVDHSGQVSKREPLASGFGDIGQSVAAYNGAAHLVVWMEAKEGRYYLLGKLVGSTGTAVSDKVLTIASGAGLGEEPAVASSWQITSAGQVDVGSEGALAGQGAWSPGDVVRQYWSLVAEGDYLEALQYVAEGAQLQAQLGMAFSSVARAAGSAFRVLWVRTLRIEEGEAAVEVTLYFDDTGSKVFENQLREVQGQWKITGSSSASDTN